MSLSIIRLRDTAHTLVRKSTSYNPIEFWDRLLIGPTSLSEYSVVVNTAIIIDSTGLGLVNNWIILAIADDEGCALVAEEVKYGKYRGFFTNNLKLVITCLDILNDILGSIKKINV